MVDDREARAAVARRDFEGYTPRSLEHHVERSSRVMPNGTARSRHWWPYPVYMERGEGAYLYDLDGNRYVDCLLGFGPLILGHRPAPVIAALARQLERGLQFGAPSVDQYELARRIVANVPDADWVAFLSSGTEATMAAIRVARAATGRLRVAKFEGGFHGWHDMLFQSFARTEGPPEAALSIPESLGIPADPSDHLVTLPFNHPAALERLRKEASGIACVVVEGVQGGGGAIPADAGFMGDLRRACDETGVLLVLDEVITGFRLGPSGAAGHLGVKPDLTTLGKVIGGGMPVGALCGSAALRELMDSERVVMAGTFSDNPMTMVAGRAQLDALLADGGAAYERLRSLGDRMRGGLAGALSELSIEGQVTGLGSIWGLHFMRSVPRSRRDLAAANEEVARHLPSYLFREGVFVATPMHLAFVSTAHDEDSVDYVVEAHVRALAAMKRDGFFA